MWVITKGGRKGACRTGKRRLHEPHLYCHAMRYPVKLDLIRDNVEGLVEESTLSRKIRSHLGVDEHVTDVMPVVYLEDWCPEEEHASLRVLLWTYDVIKGGGYKSLIWRQFQEALIGVGKQDRKEKAVWVYVNESVTTVGSWDTSPPGNLWGSREFTSELYCLKQLGYLSNHSALSLAEW